MNAENVPKIVAYSRIQRSEQIGHFTLKSISIFDVKKSQQWMPIAEDSESFLSHQLIQLPPRDKKWSMFSGGRGRGENEFFHILNCTSEKCSSDPPPYHIIMYVQNRVPEPIYSYSPELQTWLKCLCKGLTNNPRLWPTRESQRNSIFWFWGTSSQYWLLMCDTLTFCILKTEDTGNNQLFLPLQQAGRPCSLPNTHKNWSRRRALIQELSQITLLVRHFENRLERSVNIVNCRTKLSSASNRADEHDKVLGAHLRMDLPIKIS